MTNIVRVVLGTIALLLALVVAVGGFAVSQGERDILSIVLAVSGALAAAALGLFVWAAVTWYRRSLHHDGPDR